MSKRHQPHRPCAKARIPFCFFGNWGEVSLLFWICVSLDFVHMRTSGNILLPRKKRYEYTYKVVQK